MEDVYERVVETLSEGSPVALATLMTRLGSSPGSLGAKMLIWEDGSMTGSIGGGCVEAEVWEAGRQVLAERKPQVLAFRLSAQDMAESGLICGGSIEILVEPVTPEMLPIYEQILGLRKGGGRGLLATAVPEGAPGEDEEGGAVEPGGPEAESTTVEAAKSVDTAFKVLLLESGEVVNPLGRTAPIEAIQGLGKKLGPGASQAVSFNGAAAEEAPGVSRVFLESLGPQVTVYIFGAGHLASELAPIAKRVHFQVTVVDDRPFFADPERFPEADEVVAMPFETAFDSLEVDEDSFVVIVTRGHIHDGVVLEQALRSPASYLGMIGSRAKIRAVYEELEAKGIPRERLEEVHAPIGLDIRARLPEEIAVSILAELIKVRNERIGA